MTELVPIVVVLALLGAGVVWLVRLLRSELGALRAESSAQLADLKVESAVQLADRTAEVDRRLVAGYELYSNPLGSFAGGTWLCPCPLNVWIVHGPAVASPPPRLTA